MTDAFGNANVNFLDMAGSQAQLAQTMLAALKPVFADLGLSLESFVVENISLPEELQKMLDQRIGMNMIGDMNRYTQFQVAQSMPIAAANEGGGAAGIGAGLGAGHGDGAADDECHEAGGSAGTGAARTGGVPAPAAGGRDQVLPELRQADSEAGAVLPGVRRRAAIATSGWRWRWTSASYCAIRLRCARRPTEWPRGRVR